MLNTMLDMKKIIITVSMFIVLVPVVALSAPYYRQERTILPITDSLYDLGTSTKAWRDLYVDQICLSADCKTAWPSGGGGVGWATTTSDTESIYFYGENNVGIGTSSPYATLSVSGDVVVNSYQTIGTPTSGDAVFDIDATGSYTLNGDTFGLRIWAYKTVGSQRVYSPTYFQIQEASDNYGSAGTITFSWSSVADADGYRIKMYDQQQNGYNYDYYQDWHTDSIIFGDSDCNECNFTADPGDGSELLYASPHSFSSIVTDGNIGIGTTSPYAPLSVVGQALASYFTATSTTATSLFSGNLTVGNVFNSDGGTIFTDGAGQLSAGSFIGTSIDTDQADFDTIGNGTSDVISTLNYKLLGGGGDAIDWSDETAIEFPNYDCSALGNGGKLTVNASGVVVCDDDGGSGGSLSGGSTNTLTYWTSSSTVGATSSPTVGYITATSTTATSTLPNLTVSNRFLLAPVVLVKPDGTQIPYGQGTTTDIGRGNALSSAVSASTAGDSVLVVSDGTYRLSNTITMASSTTIRGIGRPTVESIFTGSPTITVKNSTTTIDGIKISTADIGIGYIGSDTLNITDVLISDVEVTPNDTDSCAVSWGISCASSAGSQHLISGTIRNSRLISGASSGFGVRVVLAAGAVLEMNNNTVFGATDGVLFNGSASAIVRIDGGYYTSTLDPITSGGATIYVNGAKAEGLSGGTNADLYEDGGDIIATNVDYTTAGEQVTGTQRVPTAFIVGLDSQAGKIGVNATPLSALDVNGGATIGTYAGVTTAPANSLIVSGNIGIGTTSPYAKLSVVGQVVGSYFTATSTTATSTLGKVNIDDALTYDGVGVKIYDKSFPFVVGDFVNHQLYYEDNLSLDWGSPTGVYIPIITDDTFTQAIDPVTRHLYDNNGTGLGSVWWNERNLVAEDGSTVALDWSDASLLSVPINMSVSGSLYNSTLTSGRVPYVTTGGRITDSADLLFSGNDLTIGDDLFVTDDIGVNNTSPQADVHIRENGTIGIVIERAANCGSYGFFNTGNSRFVQNVDSAFSNASLEFHRGKTGCSQGSVAGYIDFAYADNADYNARIIMYAADSLRFQGTANYVFDGSGSVGIKTASPDRDLEILDTTNPQLRLTHTDSSVYTDLQTNSSGYFNIAPTGNRVGIGTTTPSKMLSVGGDIIGNNLIGSYFTGTSTATSTFAGAIKAKQVTIPESILSTSTSMTIDWGTSNQQVVRMGTAATTISFTGQSDGQTLRLLVCNPASGTVGTITWGTEVLWAGGVAPGQTTTANKCDVWSFIATGATSTSKIFGSVNSSF